MYIYIYTHVFRLTSWQLAGGVAPLVVLVGQLVEGVLPDRRALLVCAYIYIYICIERERDTACTYIHVMYV